LIKTNSQVIEVLKNKGKLANRFPGIHGLAHKDFYSRIMKIAADIDEEAISFVPKQFTFPADRDSFL
jgi:hypothetical protein